MQKDKSKRKDMELLERVANIVVIASRRKTNRIDVENRVRDQFGRALCAQKRKDCLLYVLGKII